VQALTDGDRLRIGTQELVFSEVPVVQLAAHRTGFLNHCATCRLPYPEEAPECPSCGSSEVEEDSTLSGVLDDQGRLNWALQMLIDMLRKALALNRHADAERIMTQAMANVDERLKSPEQIDERQMEALSLEALKLDENQGNALRAKWLLHTYRRLRRLPARTVAEGISKLPTASLVSLTVELDDLVACAPIGKLSPREVEGLARLETLRASLHGG
jgi:hypothetical protein